MELETKAPKVSGTWLDVVRALLLLGVLLLLGATQVAEYVWGPRPLFRGTFVVAFGLLVLLLLVNRSPKTS